MPGTAYASVSTNDGGCILTGLGDSSKAFTIKLGSNGNLVWNKSYGGSDVRLYCIIRTADGNFVACGRDWRTNIDGLIIKIDSSGNLIWQKYYLAGFDKTLESILETPERNLVVTGIDMKSYGVDTGKTLIMKLNANGDTIWSKRYVAFSASIGKSINISSGNYIIAGDTQDTSAISNASFPYFIRTDTSGNLLFKKVYTSFTNEAYLNFAVLDNKYILSTSKIINPEYLPAKVYVIDTLGTFIRQRSFNDTGQAELPAIFKISNNDIILAGYLQTIAYTRHDFYVIRIDSLLNAPPIGIKNISTEIPKIFSLYQNYPNPFNPKTIIKFDLPKDGLVTIKIYDILGKVVGTMNEFKKAGSYEYDFDGSNFASGLYFYRIESGPFAETKKMVLIK